MTDDALLAVFRAEAEEVVGQVVLELDRWPGLATDALAGSVRAVQRALHNLKGGARLVGVFDAEMVAHLLEGELEAGRALDVQGRVREGVYLLLDLIDGRASDARVQTFVAGGVHTTAAAAPPPPAPTQAPAQPAPDTAASTSASSPVVRVLASRLDAVLAIASDLPSGVERRLEVARELEEVGARLLAGRQALPESARRPLDEATRDLTRLAEQLRALSGARLADDLGEALKRLRMQRLDELRPAWQRVVDETAAQLGREARLEVDVADVELDREVMDRLRDPLMHLLRNAVDHGVGDAAARRARGQGARGTVRVGARARGLMVELVIEDDGAGLDLATIRQRGEALGLIAPGAGDVDELALADLVFTPGFSTATAVSAVSGRGVGLDVVRSAVQQLGGSVTIGRASRGGTVVAIKVPASVVTTRALVVVAEETRAAVPIAAVIRVRRVQRADVVVVDGEASLPRAGGPPLPVRWLSAPTSTGDTILVVEVETPGGAVALVVDDIVGERALVVRALPWSVGTVPGVIGAAVLHDGRALPVLDPSTMRRVGSEAAVAPRAAQATRARILVVDDSLTSRTLQKSILGGEGHDVVLATDGEDAWERLQQGAFDLVVSDVEMPRLDGLELVRRIRRSTTLAALPVVLVTSLERPEEIAAGADAGADAYIVKGRFDQRVLLEHVARLLGGAR